MKKWIKALHRDEKGADMVEYVLIVAAVALPLLAVIIWFWKDISKWIGEVYAGIRAGTTQTDPKDL
jgi:Flp pilus assembly pilin Flp